MGLFPLKVIILVKALKSTAEEETENASLVNCCSWINLDYLQGNTGVGCRFLLQGIFPTQGLNQGLPHCKQMLYHLSHQGALKDNLRVRTDYN